MLCSIPLTEYCPFRVRTPSSENDRFDRVSIGQAPVGFHVATPIWSTAVRGRILWGPLAARFRLDFPESIAVTIPLYYSFALIFTESRMTISGHEIKRAGAKNQTEFADLFELLTDLSDFSLRYVNTLELSSSDLRQI